MGPVTGTDFEFYNHGDDGNPPDKLVVNFKAGFCIHLFHLLIYFTILNSPCLALKPVLVFCGSNWHINNVQDVYQELSNVVLIISPIKCQLVNNMGLA